MTADLTDNVNAFLSGIMAMGYATAGLFLLRFWNKTGDRLFALFASAFWLLGMIRVAMVLLGEPGDEHFLYWIRFGAYLIILAAILDKNLRR